MPRNAPNPSLPCGRLSRCRPLPFVGTLLVAATGGLHAWAVPSWEVRSDPLNAAIPDGGLEGLAHSLIVDAPFDTLRRLSVGVTLEPGDDGGFLGDLYLTLVHDGRVAVLLNRPGRTATDPFGYDEGLGISVTFDDDAAAGDMHRYRNRLGPAAQLGGPSPLVGTWQPDGRLTDPLSALDVDPRDALLNVFADNDPDGRWTLFAADLSVGGTFAIHDWWIRLEPDAPVAAADSGSVLGLLGLGTIAITVARQRVASQEIRSRRCGGSHGGRRSVSAGIRA